MAMRTSTRNATSAPTSAVMASTKRIATGAAKLSGTNVLAMAALVGALVSFLLEVRVAVAALRIGNP